MKKIIETSLEFSGVSVNARTLFNPNDQSKVHYYDLSKKAGKTVRVWYDWELNGQIYSEWKNVEIPEGLNELAVKNLILAEISK
jgi:hypothetical protein